MHLVNLIEISVWIKYSKYEYIIVPVGFVMILYQ